MKNTENKIRYNNGWGGYNIYDICYSEYSLNIEMNENKFKIIESKNIGNDIFPGCEEELSRVVTVKKRDKWLKIYTMEFCFRFNYL